MNDDLGKSFAQGRLLSMIESALEYFIAILMEGAYLARITTKLGFSDALTGILSSFISLSCIFQLLAMMFLKPAKRIKRTVIAGTLINELLFAMVYLAPVFPLSQTAKTLVFLICFCGAYLVLNAVKAHKSTWKISLVEDRQLGIYSARNEIMSLLSGMVFTYIMGSIIDHLETSGKLQAAFICGAMAIAVLAGASILILLRIPERETEAQPKTGIKIVFSFFKDRRFLKLVLVLVIWRIAYYASVPFYGAYQIKELGFSMTYISIMSVIYSLLRSFVSPWIGKYADRHSFSRMLLITFGIMTLGFGFQIFAVPSNGKVFFMIYNALSAIAMAGINSGSSNLIFSYVKGQKRAAALAFSQACSGIVGFLATCAFSPLVNYIQNNGNVFAKIHVYPTQVVSCITFILLIGLMFYLKFCIINHEERFDS